MLSLELMVTFALFGSLALYVLSGGADYGAGVWNIFSPKTLARRQEDLITEAIQPIWEANHVWLILIVTILFTAFPEVFAFICTTLNIPISLALIGIVMRGTAFVSRKYDLNNDVMQKTWAAIFSSASVITPFLYGCMIGAISAGHLEMPTQDVWGSLFAPWLTPYALSLGGFTLAIFAMLAATYLIVDAKEDEELVQLFRKQSLVAHVVVGIFGVAAIAFASQEHIWVYDHITDQLWAPIAAGTFILLFCVTSFCLFTRKFKAARLTAAAEVLVILTGYALAQFPYLIPEKYTIFNTAAPHIVLQYLLIALSVGAVLLFPALYFLFHIFKAEEPQTSRD